MKRRFGRKSTDSEQQQVYGCCVHGVEPLFYIKGRKVSNLYIYIYIYIYILHNEIHHISADTQMMMCNREVLCILRVLEVWREDDLKDVACVKIGT